MSIKLVVVTVNYCCAEAILGGMAQTVAQLRDMGDAEFWIVDNASPDASLARLKSAVAQAGYQDVVKIIASDQNGGFGAGNNVAIRQAQNLPNPPDFLYFLNPDAEPAAGAIAKLRSFMDAKPNVGIAGSLLRNEHGDLEASFFKFPSFWSEVEKAVSFGPLRKILRNYVVVLPPPDAPAPVDWVSGASFIARLSALDKAGAFDERFFLYWEEVELNHRVKAAGYDIYAVPEAEVMHIGGVSTGVDPARQRTPPYWFASRRHFFEVTGIVRNVTVLNIVVVICFALQRLHLALRFRPQPSPDFLKDFIRYSFRRSNI